MKRSSLAAAVLLLIACAATVNLAQANEPRVHTPTGEILACSEIPGVRDTDMPRLFGIDNFFKAHLIYVKFRTFAPQDCKAGFDTYFALETGLDGRLDLVSRRSL